MKRIDLNLLVLAAAAVEGKVLSPVQYQKSIFMINRHLLDLIEDTPYEFTKGPYGPMTLQIYTDERILNELKFTVRSKCGAEEGYMATYLGCKQAKKIGESLTPDAVTYIKDVVAWAHDQPLDSLVASMRQNFPEYAE